MSKYGKNDNDIENTSDFEIDYNSIPVSFIYSKDELLEKVFFAYAMYLNKTRGA